jgi:hypothetical protein
VSHLNGPYGDVRPALGQPTPITPQQPPAQPAPQQPSEQSGGQK